MLRKLAFLLAPIVLFGAACSGGGGGSATKSTSPTSASVHDTNGDGIYDSSQPPADVSGNTQPIDDTTDTSAATDTSSDTPVTDVSNDTTTHSPSSGPASLFGAVSPFDLLDAASGDTGSSQPADPASAQVLLALSDLPNGFAKLEETTHTVPGEYGDMSLTMNAFASGDLDGGGDFGAVVASATVLMPQAALDEFERQGGFDALSSLSADDMNELEPEAQQLGVAYRDVHGIDGAGLGDGGGGFHIVIDMGALLDIFGPTTEGPNPWESGIAYDMIFFLRGDQMFLVMVMWPGDQSSGVDSLGLAHTLDARAAAAGY